jgi:hypothetical protein
MHSAGGKTAADSTKLYRPRKEGLARHAQRSIAPGCMSIIVFLLVIDSAM